MRIQDLSHWVCIKFLLLFLTAERPLPKSSNGDVKYRSLGGGMADGEDNAAVPLAATQICGRARTAACLIVQRSRPSQNPITSLSHCPPIRRYRAHRLFLSGVG
jgi:hypothetical protein